MENQKLPSLSEKKWFRLWIIKKDEPILLTPAQYMGVIASLEAGKKFALINFNLIMLNSITLIEPIKRPAKELETRFSDNMPINVDINKQDRDEWDEYFSDK